MSRQPISPQEAQARAALREKYARTIERLWKEPDDCPICGSNVWNLGDLIQARLRDIDVPLTLEEALVERPPQVYVYVPMSCLQCGYTIFFHTGILDVRDQETIKSEGPLRRPQ
jgi:predicted nucleic-acid-binding Zn-ribbon protein